MNTTGFAVILPDGFGAGIAPIHLYVFKARLRLALTRSSRKRGTTSPCRDQHFVEESLAHLVDDDQVLERSVGKVDSGGSSERKRRMAWKHIGVGIASGEVSWNVKRAGVREILLHSREVRPNPHSGDDAARVLTARSQKRPATRYEGRFSPRRIEHGTRGDRPRCVRP